MQKKDEASLAATACYFSAADAACAAEKFTLMLSLTAPKT